jgi:hypothetical protein
MSALGKTIEQPVTVRMDPRIKVTAEDMQVWHREATTIERTDCTLDRASADLASLDVQLTETEGRANTPELKAAVTALRRELRPVALVLRGEGRGASATADTEPVTGLDPVFVNLPGRINWLTIQVGNYSGRPTAAQIEWIAKYADQADLTLKRFESIKSGSLAQLNAKLKAAGLPEIAVRSAGSM